MIGNYIKLALRHMVRQKSYVFINVTGLTVGLACSILIALFVIHEVSYDGFNEKKNHLFKYKTILAKALISKPFLILRLFQ